MSKAFEALASSSRWSGGISLADIPEVLSIHSGLEPPEVLYLYACCVIQKGHISVGEMILTTVSECRDSKIREHAVLVLEELSRTV